MNKLIYRMLGTLVGVLLLFFGMAGPPSNLDEPINTATIVFLTGILILTIVYKKGEKI